MAGRRTMTNVVLGVALSAVGIVAIVILDRYDLVGPLPVWVLSLAFVLAVVASHEGLHERLAAGERTWQTWLRICLQAILIAPSMYLSGWGSLIPIIAFFPIAISQLRAFGSRTCYPVMAGTTITVVAGQAGIAAGVVPNHLPVLTAHSVAFIQLVSTVLTVAYLSSMAKARENAERTLADRERRFRKLVHHSTDLIMLTGLDGRIQWVSPSAVTHLDRRPAELVGTPIDTLADLGDRDLGDTLRTWAGQPDQPPLRLEWRLHPAGDGGRWYDVTIQNLLDDPDVGALLINQRDVTEVREAREQLLREATHDALTGLLNRAAFARSLAEVSRRVPEHGGFAILYIDLNAFKPINDTYGHEAGDTVLIAVARAMSGAIRATDVAARLGGDEFAVLLTEVFEPEDARTAAARISDAVNTPVVVAGQILQPHVSIGIATADGGEVSAEELMRRADTAMYRAKREHQPFREHAFA